MIDILSIYETIKKDIDRRLGEFARLWKNGSDMEIFKELCFCTCTPQNDAHKAWGAVLRLEENGLIEGSGHSEIAEVLRERGVRFHKNKARYIVTNRDVFYPDTKNKVRELIKNKTLVEARDDLQKKVFGWGLKEASHFLRNTGMGDGICILDRHIMRQLALYGVIKEIPASISGAAYHEIEQKMLVFAEKEKVPVDALDLIFWYKEKNELFK
ncbi:MAG: N-glycosylase/DNA lyase [Spirochaetaceae bacterium]|nr:N-glycosylase/DNA lyase [Spirochaetaceae bacterium]